MILLSYIFTIIILVFCLILILFMDFSIWFIIFQNIISLSLIFLLIFYFKSVRYSFKRFGKFLFYYLILEVIFDLIILLNYLFCIESLFIMVFIFKISGFPFIFYNNLFNSLLLNLRNFRVIITIYLLISKILITVLIFVIPVPLESFLVYAFISLMYFILYFKFSIKCFIANSLIFSNLMFLTASMFLNQIFVISYIIITSYSQYKVLAVFSNSKFKSTKDISYFFLTIINGNPILIFNWFKFYIQSIILSFSFLLCFLYVTVSSLFLSYSLIILLNNIKYLRCNFKVILLNLLFTTIIIQSLILTLYLEDYILDSSFIGFMFFNSYQFVNLLPGVFSINYFLIYGENVSVSLCLIFFIFYMFFKSLDFNNFLGFSNINPSVSLLNNPYNVRIGKICFSFNYFDRIIFIIPYFLIMVSTGNFVFLVENIDFLNISDVMVLVFILAFQWGWEISIKLSSNWPTYYNIFYTNNYTCKPFISNLDFKFYTLMITNILILLNPNITSLNNFNLNLIDILAINMINNFINNPTINNVLYLPKRVNIFIQGMSLDVIHALYIPTLSIKEDLIKDKVFSTFINILDFSGDYLEFICFEYCGDFHHSMSGHFTLLSVEDFSLRFNK